MCPQSADLAVTVSKKLETLSAMSLNELAALPKVSEEEIRLEGKKHVLCTWHDVLDHGEHRIVVQAFERGVLSVKNKCVEGFVVNTRNEKRPLSTTDLAAFD